MARRRNTEETQTAQEATSEPVASVNHDQDLYESEVSRYSDTLDRDLDDAFERYGFTLFHSLPGLKQLELSQKLGLLRHDAMDHYNLASAAAQADDIEGAMKLYQKALELDGTLADAAYNLAVCYERLDRQPEAINSWSRFLELTQSDEDRAAVEAHLAELNAGQ